MICIAVAGLEGLVAGRGVRHRLSTLRMPRYSPPFPAWIVIGVVYYAICFIVLRHLLGNGWTVSLILLVLIMLANALWSVLFFRWRDLRASFIAFIPYAGLVAALVVSLASTYPLGAALFACYCAYLLYAAWWGYRLWRLNTPNQAQKAHHDP